EPDAGNRIAAICSRQQCTLHTMLAALALCHGALTRMNARNTSTRLPAGPVTATQGALGALMFRTWIGTLFRSSERGSPLVAAVEWGSSRASHYLRLFPKGPGASFIRWIRDCEECSRMPPAHGAAGASVRYRT